MESTAQPAINQITDPVEAYLAISGTVCQTDGNITVVYEEDDEAEDEEGEEDDEEEEEEAGQGEEEEEEDEENARQGREPTISLSQSLKNYRFHFRPYVVGTANDETIYLDDKAAGTLLNPNLELLLAESQPAPFGRGEETVFDESVRRARSIPGDRLKKNYHQLERLQFKMQYLAMQLYAGRSVDVKLSKLHIYEKNGHFTPHRDTLRSNDHVGSIVVLLGTPFTGGEFIINGEQCVLDVDHAAETVSFVAFYTDILHEVRPVTSGVRVSLQFDVFAKGQKRNRASYLDSEDEDRTLEERFTCSTVAPVVDEERCDAVVAALVARLRRSPNMIIPTYHRYHQYALHTNTLKPVDDLLARKLVERGCTVTPVPLNLVEERYEDSYGGGHASHEVGASLFWQAPFDNENAAVAPKGTRFVVPSRVEGEQLFYQSYIDHTGNESQPAIFAYYLSGLLISAAQDQATNETDAEQT